MEKYKNDNDYKLYHYKNMKLVIKNIYSISKILTLYKYIKNL